MKPFHFVLIFCLLGFATNGHCQDSPEVDVKLNRLLDAIYEYHIQPRKIDDAFLSDFEEALFEAIDPVQMLLSEEEVVIIKNMSADLKGAIRMEAKGFADSTYSIWNKGISRTRVYLSSLEKHPLKLDMQIDSNLFNDFVPENQLNEKLNAYLQLQTLSDAVERMGVANDFENRQAFVDSARMSVTEEFAELLDLLEDRELFDEVFLNAIANTFDPHTGYFSNTGYEDFKEDLSGGERELFGIGYKKNGKGQIEISNVVPGSSAWLSGEISVGDIVLEIDFGNTKHSLEGKTPRDLGKLFEENTSKEITLTVQTGKEKPREVELIKTRVFSDGDNIKSAVLNGKKTVGYISLPDFYTNWESEQGLGCANDVAKAVVKLKKESVEGIILDLRNNGGGSLKEAVDLAGIFLNYGPILVTNDGREKPYTIKDLNRGLIFSGPLIVMVNGYSASASEVVSAALQDHNRAVIVGGRSYGKATGQSFLPLTEDGEFPMTGEDVFGQAKITNATLYRINLETNQARGVIPDIYLPISNLYEGNYESEERTALRLDSISKKMYYTPLGASPIPAMKARSEERILRDSIITKVLAYQHQMEKKSETFDPYLASLEEWVLYEKEMKELNDKQDALIEDYSVSFRSEPLQFDAELYEVNEVLRKYNNRFLERLQNDIDLSETYLIMNQLIEN